MDGERIGVEADATIHTVPRTEDAVEPHPSAQTIIQPSAPLDFSLDAPAAALQHTDMSAPGHERSQDSFSRSRTSTETILEAPNSYDASENPRIAKDPQLPSSSSSDPAFAPIAHDAVGVAGHASDGSTSDDIQANHNAREQLEAWSKDNAVPEAAPLPVLAQPDSQIIESRQGSVDPLREDTEYLSAAETNINPEASQEPIQGSTGLSGPAQSQYAIRDSNPAGDRNEGEAPTAPLIPPVQDEEDDPNLTRAQLASGHQGLQLEKEQGFVSKNSSIQHESPSYASHVAQDSRSLDIAEDGKSGDTVEPLSPKTGEDDAWAKALGVVDTPVETPLPVPSAYELSLSMPEAGNDSIPASLEIRAEDEAIHELRESLVQPSHTEASPLPPGDDGFLGAMKEMSGDLEVPSEHNPILESHAEPVEPATTWDEKDSWEKEFSAPKQADGDASWESAFGDGLDDDGFLDDEHGFLEDTPIVANEESSVAPVQQQTEVKVSNPYGPTSADIRFADAASQDPGVHSAQNPMPDQSRSMSGGMKFFEDLPMTQPTRSKKPRQVVPSLPSPNAVPPSGTRSGPPPTVPQRRSSAQQGPYPQLVGPQKLEMFPPQPSQPPPPAISHPTSSAGPHTTSLQPPVTKNSRYSPAPSHPASGIARYANVSSDTPPTASRYSPSQQHPHVPGQASLASSSNLNMIPPGPHGPAASPHYPQQPDSHTQVPPAPRRVDTRYSPAPPPQPAAHAVPAGTTTSHQSTYGDSSYQPASGPPPPPPIPAQRFIPRTSSPLRSAVRPQVDRSQTVGAPLPQITDPQHFSQPVPAGRVPPLPRSTTQANYSAQAPPTQSSVSLPLEPPETAPPRVQQDLYSQPPQRPRTQSPQASRARYAATPNDTRRKISIQDPSTNLSPSIVHMPAPFTTTGPSSSDNINFVQPDDPAQSSDPLSRWKGSPSVQWCPGGSVAVHFPKHVPRYGGGQSAPAIKCSPGDIKLRKSKEAMPADDSLRTFPGPLKSKGKKKELLAWLSSRIEVLQLELSATQTTSLDPRASERLLLWQIVRASVEHDGQLSGNPAVDLAVRQIFSSSTEHREVTAPAATETSSSAPVNDPLTVLEIRKALSQGDREKAVWRAVDARQWGHAMLISSTMDGTLWKQVSQEFVRTEVRSTVHDNKSLAALYAIFSHNWDESIDELVPASARAGFQMVPAAGTSSQASNNLGGLNDWQETLSLVLHNRSSEDEKGLLALGKLLRSYGRIEAAHVCFLFAKSVAQLGGVDDPEANFTLLGTDVGADAVHDIDAILLSESYEFSTSLVGSSTTHYMPHLQAYKLHHAHSLAESGYRTEALQYCDAISAAIKSTTRPSQYYHPVLITQLDDLTKRLSQSPKDSSSSWMAKPSIGKVSSGMWAKFNNFVAGDDDSASNGSGQPTDSDVGPFSRFAGGTPTISRNESFADMSTLTSGGPLSGNSRYAPSYASQASNPATLQQSNGLPRDVRRPSSSNHSDFRPPIRSDSFHPPQSAHIPSPHHATHNLGISDNMSQASSSYDPPILQPAGFGSGGTYGSPHGTHSSSRAASSHGAASLPAQDHEMSAIDEEGPFAKSNEYEPSVNGYTPTTASYSSPYEPQNQLAMNNSDSPHDNSNDLSAGGGYEPPSGGYNPYEPGSPTSPTSPGTKKPKKKMFMDDDDEDDYRGSHTRDQSDTVQSATQTREPDDAVRKAAEADAARDKAAAEAKKSSGGGSWFPTLGLFNRGAKDPNAPVVHKAKLGEESSFYYDPETKKWVNKKAGASASTPGAGSGNATPPPPRAGPPMGGGGSRVPSGTSTPNSLGGQSTSGGPPMGATPPIRSSSALASSTSAIPGLGISNPTRSSGDLGMHPSSRAATPASDAGSAHSHSQQAQPPPSLPGMSNAASAANATGLQPPSRPPTSMSNASSIDDLLGAPGTQARKGGTVKKGKKGGGRYVDVMAKS